MSVPDFESNSMVIHDDFIGGSWVKGTWEIIFAISESTVTLKC